MAAYISGLYYKITGIYILKLTIYYMGCNRKRIKEKDNYIKCEQNELLH